MQITEEASSKDKRMDTEMSSAPAPAAVGVSKNVQAEMLKNMVLDLGLFDGDNEI